MTKVTEKDSNKIPKFNGNPALPTTFLARVKAAVRALGGKHKHVLLGKGKFENFKFLDD